MRKKLRLVRVHSGPDGTFGVLTHEHAFALTCEDPWDNNRVGASCIPAGNYMVLRCSKSPEYGFKPSAKYGDIFNVQDVPGRSLILIHRGNLPKDTEGCILVGEEFGYLGGKPAVLDSRGGWNEFMELLRYNDGFELEIVEAY